MRAELLKVRSMPTPLWCLIAVAICALLGLAATGQWGLGGDMTAIWVAVYFPLAIASIVFGVWMVGVEYGQDTLRRSLTADPRRTRLVASKLLIAVLLVLLVSALVYLVAFPLFDLAADRHGQSLDISDYRGLALASMLTNFVYVLVGAAFALLTASMAGGITSALIFAFVLDTVLSIVPKVGDYTLGVAVADLIARIPTSDATQTAAVHSAEVSVMIVALWLCGLLLVGWLRFWRSDVK